MTGEASSPLEALDLSASLQPDLILLDLSMPGLGGLDSLPQFHRRAPQARILILTMQNDLEYLRQAAPGYTGAEIAGQLNLSVKTVETYRARGMEKLDLSNRAAQMRFALGRGLLSAE